MLWEKSFLTATEVPKYCPLNTSPCEPLPMRSFEMSKSFVGMLVDPGDVGGDGGGGGKS